MTNFEKYKDTVLSIVDKRDFVAIVNDKPTTCSSAFCTSCKNNDYVGRCTTAFIKWLYEEYQERPKLSEKAYHLLKAFPDDAEIIIANGFLYVVVGGVMDSISYNYSFLPEFPEEVENGKRYKVSDLLKFEVEG